MKELKDFKIILIVLTGLLLGACADNRPSSLNEGPKVSPKVKKEVRINDKGEQVIDLDLINKEDLKDQASQRLREALAASKKARIETKLAPLKGERLSFSKPTLTLKKDGREEISLEVTFKGEKHPITFLSPEDHEQDFFFEQTDGFTERKVSLQGMCLDDSEDCLKLAVQVAYYFKDLKVTEQFVVSKVKEDESIESEGVHKHMHTTDDSEDSIDSPSDNSTEEDRDVAPLEVTLDENDGQGDFLTNNPKPIEPTKPAKENEEPTNITLDEGDDEDDFLTNNSQPIEPTKPVKEDEEPTKITLDEEEFAKLPTGADAPVPTKRPDNGDFAKLPTGADIPIPTKRPEHPDANPDIAAGDGQLIFPDLNDDDKEKHTFNVNAGEDTPKEPTSSAGADRILKDIQTKKYNQARGYYARHKVAGHIKRGLQLSRNTKGVVANKRRRDRQYGSGLLLDALKYSADKLSAKYPKSPVCTNDLSKKGGGALGGHKSHRNGLDADISYPSTANKCSGSFFHHWTKFSKKDSKFMQKNWEFIKILMSTERVHVIFTDRSFARSLCKYIKRGNRSTKSQRKKIFQRLYHMAGHANHYHIRMKCNRQNTGCVTQPMLNGEGKLTCN